jgi:hypothetical protein
MCVYTEAFSCVEISVIIIKNTICTLQFVNNYNNNNNLKRNAYRILVGNPEGKRPLGRQRRRWVNNVKQDLRETGWDGMDWIDLAQGREH